VHDCPKANQSTNHEQCTPTCNTSARLPTLGSSTGPAHRLRRGDPERNIARRRRDGRRTFLVTPTMPGPDFVRRRSVDSLARCSELAGGHLGHPGEAPSGAGTGSARALGHVARVSLRAAVNSIAAAICDFAKSGSGRSHGICWSGPTRTCRPHRFGQHIDIAASMHKLKRQ